MIYAHYTGEKETKVRRNLGLISYLLSGIATFSILYFHSAYPELLGARFGLLYPAVFLIAWFAGVGAGIFSLGLFLFGFGLYVLPADPENFIRLMTFGLTSAFVLWVIQTGKNAQARLKTNHGLFKTSLESIGDAVILTDRDHSVMFMNPMAERLTGKSLLDVRCSPLLSVLKFEGESIATFNHALTDVFEGKRPWESKGHCRLIRSDGKTQYVEISCAPIRIEDGTMGLVIVLKDVGRMQEALTSLTQSEERLRLATDVSELGIWEANLLTGFVARNLNHDEIFGYSELLPHWVIGDYEARLHPEDKESVMELINNATRECESFASTFRIMRDDHTFRWVNATGKVECGHDGKAIRIIGTLMDITEKKKSEDMLHEALFYRDEFLSIASHELKTPLTSLKLQSQMFKRHIEKNDGEAFSHDRIKRFMAEADTQVSRLTRLVDDMLDISRIRTGRLSISTEKVEISNVVKEVVDRMRPHFSSLEIGDFHHGEVVCDRLRIEQVITNILNNALRYGKGRPVRVDLRENGGEMVISVTDNGMGIPESFKDKIFSRFQRAVPASEVSGLGLGLYISKQIVEAHQGRISVDSELHKGSCFTVQIPKGEVVLQ
ncbi:MAG: ATP-binding protein [Bdellovibrionota bacterium]